MYDKNYRFFPLILLWIINILYIILGTVRFILIQDIFFAIFVLTKYLNNKKIIIIHYDTEIKLTQS